MSKSPSTPKADLPEVAANEGSKGGPIVSSSHLVSARSPELSEFEFALNTAYNAYNRWCVRCMAAAGVRDLTFLDVLVVHHVNHRGRAKRLADICFVLNVEDTHLVTYSLKKLQGMELVEGTRSGKEVTYTTTAAGEKACARYREIREQCLTSNISPSGEENAEIGELARLLRVLTGLYEQAARSELRCKALVSALARAFPGALRLGKTG